MALTSCNLRVRGAAAAAHTAPLRSLAAAPRVAHPRLARVSVRAALPVERAPQAAETLHVAAASTDSSSSAQAALWSSPAVAALLLGQLAEGTDSSYNATLFLFLISFPGLYSLVKRSTKSKIERKTFEVPGPAAAGAQTLDERARALFAFFKRNNYGVTGTGEVISFEGLVKPERGTAAYITFCAGIGLASGALVLSIAVPAIGDLSYWMIALAPAAGAYYWVNAERKETMKVKIVTSDDELLTDIIIEGDAEEIARCSRELGLTPKGMIRVEGILEKAAN